MAGLADKMGVLRDKTTKRAEMPSKTVQTSSVVFPPLLALLQLFNLRAAQQR